jgi:hypothetical protein
LGYNHLRNRDRIAMEKTEALVLRKVIMKLSN